jgi:hypothetical protein
VNSTSTPGPWQIQPLDQDFLIVHSDRELRSHIARLQWSTLCEEHGSLEANACLIASAPSLLSVLQQISDDVEAWSDSGDSELFHERMHANADDARAAIAKAKGGAK